MSDLNAIFNSVMNWLIAPVFGAIVWLLTRLRQLATQNDALRHEISLEIAKLRAELRVLETRQEAHAAYSKASDEALHEQVGAIVHKLDSIETYLRRGDTR